MRQWRDETPPPIPTLTCGGCERWQPTTIQALIKGAVLGECAVFRELRQIDARPRCTICWSPPVVRLVPDSEEAAP